MLPVSRLYFARPFAVNPAPFDTGSFSPLVTLKFTFFPMSPPMLCCFFCNFFGLCHKLLSLLFTFALCSGRRGVFSRAERLNRRLRKIALTRIRRLLSALGCPFLVTPSLQGLLWGFNHDSPRQPLCIFWRPVEPCVQTTAQRQCLALPAT